MDVQEVLLHAAKLIVLEGSSFLFMVGFTVLALYLIKD